ncbi:MAG: response regulator [Parcubacteria group bacterium]|nr:response regulator [Parcubacteria group bacterium]
MPTTYKILLVEDDPFLLDMYSTKFKEVGFEVSAAQDGEMALVKAQDELPDLILLDIVLPKKDGFAVLKTLKSQAQTAKIPVVLLTNLGLDGDVKRGLELGAASYIIKAHFTPTEVVAKVKEILK